MNFVAIDFETANSSRSSVCSIGLVEYQDGRLIDEYYQLVKPNQNYFHSINIGIHGITEDDVKDEKEFDQLWREEIKQRLEGKLVVAHNASFDMSVLRKVLDEYRLPYPELTYNCTVNIAKKTWPHLGRFNLDALSNFLNISFEHHHALEDAHACAIVLLKACEHHEITRVQDLEERTRTENGRLFKTGYQPARATKRKRRESRSRSVRDYVAASSEVDPSQTLFNKTVVFTGALENLRRKDAEEKVMNDGGYCLDTVDTKTNYVVIGNKAYSKMKDGEKSSKLKQAEWLKAKGYPIEIISEQQFFSLLNS